MRKILLSLFVLALVAGSNVLFAQGVTTGSLSGVITDGTNNILPGATIIAVHVPSGSRYGATSFIDGRYVIQGVRVGGPYTITVSFVGFDTQVKENISVNLGTSTNVNFNLAEAVDALAEVVISASRSDIFSSDRTGAGTNVSKELLERMPTISRSFGDMTRLTPQMGGTNSFAGRSGNFNNVTIDGAVFNNAFGLSGTVGGQTSAQPISLDAIEQVQVNIAPFDVRQGSFTGAGINAVTRSGTNEFSGSVFRFTRSEKLSGFPRNTLGEKLDKQELSVQQTGFRVGGPIIEDKLFFFLNGEIERRTSPGSNFVATGSSLGGQTSTAAKSDLDALSTFLNDQYGYKTGPYEGYDRRNYSDKFTAKIDWNISENHKFNIKYNYLKSFADVNPSSSGALAGGGNPGVTHLPYKAAWYLINNNLNSVIAELNSKFGNNMFNNFTIGYSAFRDSRESEGGIFPLVNIGNGAGQSFTTFGFEPFSANNLLNTDVFQISDNLTIFKDKHTLTIGTYNEFYKFKNGFAPFFYGGYQFANLNDFYNSTPAGTSLPGGGTSTGAGRPTRYELRYSAVSGVEFPFAELKSAQLGFYVQDEYQVQSNLKITAGLRVDVPIIGGDAVPNNAVDTLVFRGGLTNVDVAKLPNTSLLFSPRIGFNWDVNNDKTTSVRGGTGIFTGRVPFVWISNQLSNTGSLFGSFVASTPATAANYPFNPDVSAYAPAGGAANATYNLAITDTDFKFPQVWRSNIGIDQKLPLGIVGTLELMYTRDLNAVYHQNVNLPNLDDATRVTTVSSVDTRPRFLTNRINGNITDAILMSNTNKGYSLNITAQLQKSFGTDFYASVAYSYTDAQSVNDGGSIAQSIWRDRQISNDPNDNVLSYSNFLRPHRFITSLNYKKEYFNFGATSISIFAEAINNGRFSYTYAGDLNGDGSGGAGNDLIYIPKDRSEINLIDLNFPNQGIVYTADQQWADLDAYIDQDKYLKNRRGEYAERNGGVSPMYFKVDLSLRQDFFVTVNDKRNTLQLSFDVFNFTNFLNKDWGIEQFATRSAVISLPGRDASGNTRYTFPYRVNPTGTVADNNVVPGQPLTSSNTKATGIGSGSLYVAQIGLRYIFN